MIKKRRLGQPSKFKHDAWELVTPFEIDAVFDTIAQAWSSQ